MQFSWMFALVVILPDPGVWGLVYGYSHSCGELEHFGQYPLRMQQGQIYNARPIEFLATVRFDQMNSVKDQNAAWFS